MGGWTVRRISYLHMKHNTSGETLTTGLCSDTTMGLRWIRLMKHNKCPDSNKHVLGGVRVQCPYVPQCICTRSVLYSVDTVNSSTAFIEPLQQRQMKLAEKPNGSCVCERERHTVYTIYCPSAVAWAAS